MILLAMALAAHRPLARRQRPATWIAFARRATPVGVRRPLVARRWGWAERPSSQRGPRPYWKGPTDLVARDNAHTEPAQRLYNLAAGNWRADARACRIGGRT